MISILIIIPTLNAKDLLPGLVKSLQSQTIDCWRVLFIDGHSERSHINLLNELCDSDPRFQWQTQNNNNSGIFGAMNQGFLTARADDWILFWGSDDRAASTTVMERASRRLAETVYAGVEPDLYVCAGHYISMSDTEDRYKRLSNRRSKFVWRGNLRKSLFCGSTPPHQATFIGKKARQKVGCYLSEFRLAADLDYFLRLAGHPDVSVLVDDYDLVAMGDSGISARENSRRFKEVSLAYQRAFGWKWIFAFFLRYLQRIHSIMQ